MVRASRNWLTVEGPAHGSALPLNIPPWFSSEGCLRGRITSRCAHQGKREFDAFSALRLALPVTAESLFSAANARDKLTRKE
jgi:hypothetical protein